MFTGIYEQVITKELQRLLQRLHEDYEILVDKIDSGEASAIFALYFKNLLEKGLKYHRGDPEAIQEQMEVVNTLINVLAEVIEDPEFRDLSIVDKKLLTGIYPKPVDRRALQELVPITSISQTSLFTGSPHEPQVVAELNREIATADRVDLLVSFIKWSGLRLLQESLERHTATKPLRVLTTSYMGATDYRAVEYLANLPNTEVKISYDHHRTRLHAKAYYFHRNTGFSTAYIGSANISKSALTEGLEWNVKVAEHSSPQIIEKLSATIDTYWNSSDFHTFDPTSVEHSRRLKASLRQERSSDGITIAPFDIRPYSYQQEILDKLTAERAVGYRRNLVVAATGTGKTVISAFDFARYRASKPKAHLLYVAHRKEILEQSVQTFRTILKDQNFGDLWVGEYDPTSFEHVFASVQTLNSSDNYRIFRPDFFDFIIFDEIHHAPADTYDKLLSYFQPDILVGLTATPERMDGQSVLEYFDDRIAAEIRLHEAINRGLLSPFHYFGVTDNVDLNDVTWLGGRYDRNELTNLYTGLDVRADLILRSARKYLTDIHSAKGLGFCVSKSHAHHMSAHFNRRGIPSMALDSDSTLEERRTAKAKLQRGEINFIFVVDLYNEGVDIPEVDTILFLRPTESATIFTQQLGRGLRLVEGKEVLTVLDYVGRAHTNFSYRAQFRSLVGKSDRSIEEEIEAGFPSLPKGCFIHLERIAKDYVLENLQLNTINRNRLRRLVRVFPFETNRPLTLPNFLNHYNIEPYEMYKTATFYQLCHMENLRPDYLVKLKNPNRVMQRVIHITGLRLISFLEQFLASDNYKGREFSHEEQLMVLMFYYTVVPEVAPGDVFARLQELKADNPHLFLEIRELLRFNRERVELLGGPVQLDYPCPLELYATYTTAQVLAALGVNTEDKRLPVQEGVRYLPDQNIILLFVTMDKSDKSFSPSTQYEDYAISQDLFHWQSQGRTSEHSAVGQRYINHLANGTQILLFVREEKQKHGITAPYFFLGKVRYVSHQGSKPMNIIWKLENPMPGAIFRKCNRILDVG